MIDLTPLDVRKKKGDLGKVMRGYDPEEVDHFLELVAERLEELVKENLDLKERVARLDVQVRGQEGREKAVHEALVTAQTVRDEIKNQAQREADLIRREAEATAQAVRDGLDRVLDERRSELKELLRARSRFLRSMRTLVERQIDAIQVEEAAPPAADFDMEAIEARASVRARKEAARPLDSLLDQGERQLALDEGAGSGGGAGGDPATVRQESDRDRMDS